MGALIFITGTDTGAGKTLVTALLLRHLREAGVDARAMKPFSAGSRADGRLLRGLQGRGVTSREVNPFHFPLPLAPEAQPFPSGKRPGLRETLAAIGRMRAKCGVLLVEGCGGLMAPLGPGFLVSDVIGALKCPVLLVAANRLGAVNHVLLSLRALEGLGAPKIGVVLSATQPGNRAVRRVNEEILRRTVRKTPLISLGFLGSGTGSAGGVKKSAKKIKKTLARIVGGDNFTGLFGTNEEKNGGREKSG